MRRISTSLLAGAMALMLFGTSASADPVESEGSAAAAVVLPSRVTHIADLRFGAFASPETNSTLRVSPNGTITPTGAVTTTMNVPQPAEGRGPARFNIEQDNSRTFIAYIPRRIDITNGTATMPVTDINGRLVRTVNAGRRSEFRLDMGGTLNIEADQDEGRYTGDFIITVLYL